VMQSDGNLVFYAVGYPSTSQYGFYWASGTSGSGVQLKYDLSGSIYLSFGNNSVHAVISSSITGDRYQRATHDSDGIFRLVFCPAGIVICIITMNISKCLVNIYSCVTVRLYNP